MSEIKQYKLDKDLIFKLAQIHCTYEEIAQVAGTTVANLQKRYKILIEQGRGEGKKSLRRSQYESAIKGDIRMQIWLGRQWLDQKDAPTDVQNTDPLPWNDNE